jgi:3-isopropylmalate/(R)-2-methylmalate dehydratase small subunit
MAGEIVSTLNGPGIPLRGNDIDTDRIIPARFLKCVTFDGIGEHAFKDDIKGLAQKGGTHPFADERFAGAAILVANKNFGCGSSREHAPQSLKRWGIKAIVAESYSEIFYGNCVSLAMPCFTADHDTCAKLQDIIEDNPTSELVVSVGESTIMVAGETITLEIQSGAQGQFLDGSWNALAGLLENLDGAKEVAASLPYVSNYA